MACHNSNNYKKGTLSQYTEKRYNYAAGMIVHVTNSPE